MEHYLITLQPFPGCKNYVSAFARGDAIRANIEKIADGLFNATEEAFGAPPPMPILLVTDLGSDGDDDILKYVLDKKALNAAVERIKEADKSLIVMWCHEWDEYLMGLH